MSVTEDAVITSADFASGQTGANWTHTVGSGSNQALYVGISIGISPVDTAPLAQLSVTYNGVAMKSVGKVKANNQEWGFSEVFEMLAPPQGAHDVVVVMSKVFHSLVGGSISFNGVDQSKPHTFIGASNFGSGTSSGTALIPSKASGKVLAVDTCGSGIASTTGTQLWYHSVDTASGGGNGMGALYSGNDSGVTPSFTNTNDWWGVVAFHINAVGDTVSESVKIITPAIGAQASFASNFGSSGSAYSLPVINVPNKAVLEIVSGSEASSSVTAIAVSDADGHTWTRLTPTFNGTTNPFATDYWYNNTGAAVDVLVHVTFTYSNNKTVGVSPRLITGSDGTPVVVASKTGASSTPQASATPALLGSLMEFDYIQPGATAIASSLVSGSTGTSGTDYVSGGSGADAVGFGSIRQSAVNAQTASPVTVGAGAPTNATYAVLLEHKPPSVSVPVGWANEGWS